MKDVLRLWKGWKSEQKRPMRQHRYSCKFAHLQLHSNRKEIMREDTQNALILKHLKKGYTINPLEALQLFGCFRLASRISDLKSSGNNIVKKMVTDGDKRFAEYRLIKGEGNEVH